MGIPTYFVIRYFMDFHLDIITVSEAQIFFPSI